VTAIPPLNDRTPREGTSARSFGCSRDGARLTDVFTQSGPTLTQLQDTVEYILGGTSTDVFGGKIDRRLPVASGAFPMWSANAITNAAGKGSFEVDLSRTPLGPPVPDEVSHYEEYHWSVEFVSKPYLILDNDRISVVSSDPATGDPVVWFNEAGVSKPYFYATEWQRYTTSELLPAVNWVTATQGQMVFRTGSGAAPNAVPFPGMPKMRMPDSTYRLTFRAIPYRWVTSANSYFERFLGYLNQDRWFQFGPGALAYQSYSFNVYCPPVQQKEDIQGVNGLIRLCDVDMLFSVTRRKCSDPPDTTAGTWNKNWIPAGFNCQPWFGPSASARRFHFATVQSADASLRAPMWPSGPLPRILFTDPDAPQIAGTFDLP
jgi:hypothetical protein